MKKFVSFSDMLLNIKNRFPDMAKVSDEPNDTTKSFRIPQFKGKIGFITSMSQNFCGSCNRLRIMADGNMKVCLFGNTEVNLKEVMRDSQSDEDLLEVIQTAGRRYLI